MPKTQLPRVTNEVDLAQLRRIEEHPRLVLIVQDHAARVAELRTLEAKVRTARHEYVSLCKTIGVSEGTSDAAHETGSSGPLVGMVYRLRTALESLEAQEQAMQTQVHAAQRRLALATEEVWETSVQPQLQAQASPALDTLIAGLDAAMLTERLTGKVKGGHAERRQVQALRDYLEAVKGKLLSQTATPGDHAAAD